MVEPVPHTAALDDYLKDLIQAVYAACSTAMPHLQDADLDVVDRAVEDCGEVLGVIMDGKVDEWIS